MGRRHDVPHARGAGALSARVEVLLLFELERVQKDRRPDDVSARARLAHELEVAVVEAAEERDERDADALRVQLSDAEGRASKVTRDADA